MTTYADILTLANGGTTSINFADNKTVLTTSEAAALIALGVSFATNDVIRIEDTASAVEALTAQQIAALKGLGASQVLANDRAMTLDIAQVNAFAAADIAAFSQYETMSATTASDTEVGSSITWFIKGMTPVALADGSYVVMYRAPGSVMQLVVNAYDANGASTGSVVLAVDSGTSLTEQPSIDALAGGGYVVVWQIQQTTLCANRYSADGVLLSSSLLTTSQNAPVNSSVVALSDGGFVVTFKEYVSGTGWSLVEQRYDADGNALGDKLNLTNNDVYSPSSDDGYAAAQIVELANGKVMIVWTDTSGADGSDWGVFGQIIDSNGSKVGDPVAINSSTAGDQSDVSVTKLSEGGFAVAWYNANDNGIYVQLFDDQGNKVNVEISVNTSSLAQDPPKIVALANGNFVVTWTWLGIDNPNSTNNQHDGVFSQIIDASGNKVGGVTLVNTNVVGSQSDPTIVVLEDGGYVIAWREYINTNSEGYEVNGQVFDADGNKVGSEFEINVNESGNQRYQKIIALAGGGFAVSWHDDSVNKYYTRVFHNDTDIASLSGTASAISALTASDAANLVEMGISTVTVEGGGDVTLTKAAAVALAAISGIHVYGAFSISVSDTGSAISDLSVSQIAALKTMGVTGLDVAGNAVTISLEAANALVSAGLPFAGDDVVTVSLTGADLENLSKSDLQALKSIGIEGFDLSDNTASLSLAAINTLLGAGLGLASGDTVTLVDSVMVLEELTASDIASLASFGVTAIDFTDNPAYMSLEQAQAFVAGRIAFAADDTVGIGATATELAGLTPSDIAAFATIHIDRIVASGSAAITIAQYDAFIANGVQVDAGIESVKLGDTGAALAALTADQISHLGDLPIRKLDASDDAVVLTAGQVAALAAANVAFDASDTIQVTVTTSGLAALSASDLSGLFSFGVSTLTSASDTLDVSVATIGLLMEAGLPFGSGFTAQLSDTAANLLALSADTISGYRTLGIDSLRLSDSASAIAGLSASNITALADMGVSLLHATEGTVTISKLQADRISTAELAFETSDTVIVSGSSATFADPDTVDLTALQSIHADRIDLSDNALSLSLDQMQTYIGKGLGFVAGDVITVRLTSNEASALDTATETALRNAGADVLELGLTSSAAKALTTQQIAALGTKGIDRINISTNAVLLSAAQVAAFNAAGISFADDDVVTQHKAPTLMADTGSTKESTTLKLSPMANDTVFDGQTLSLTAATVTSGNGSVTLNGDGTLSVRYTGPDIDGDQTAQVKVTYTVTDGIETRSATITVNVQAVTEDIIGTGGDNTLTGGAYGEKLSGLAGHDTLKGLGGADTLYGGTGNDKLYGGTGNDRVYGEDGDDTITVASGDGNDQIDGGKGTDLLSLDRSTGTKAMTLSLASTTTKQTLADGTTVVNVEQLVYSGSNTAVDTITGGALADRISGNGGNDKLSGGAGADTLYGGTGNDTLNGGTGNDKIYGEDGNDTISVSAADGNDHIDGGKGTDLLSLNRSTGTKALTLSLASTTTKQTLADGTTVVNVEQLVYSGSNTAVDTITGGALADTISGNGGNDKLSGGAGADILSGGTGNDMLNGGTGNDTLYGGAGIDALTGGTGKDTFQFKVLADLGISKTATDTIYDFSQSQGDILDFSAIDASSKATGNQAFTFLGTKAFTKHAGELRVEKLASDTYVSGDINGDGKAEFVLHLDDAVNLKIGDFLL